MKISEIYVVDNTIRLNGFDIDLSQHHSESLCNIYDSGFLLFETSNLEEAVNYCLNYKQATTEEALSLGATHKIATKVKSYYFKSADECWLYLSQGGWVESWVNIDYVSDAELIGEQND